MGRFFCARAAFNPARVLSRIKLRSNSAKTPVTWKKNWPVGVNPTGILSLRITVEILLKNKAVIDPNA